MEKTAQVLDQYDQPVPVDRLVMPQFLLPGEVQDMYGEKVSDEEYYYQIAQDYTLLRMVDWYEIEGYEGIILVSFDDIQGTEFESETEPEEAGIPMDEVASGTREIYRIDDVLKRWSPEDGIYHA